MSASDPITHLLRSAPGTGTFAPGNVEGKPATIFIIREDLQHLSKFPSNEVDVHLRSSLISLNNVALLPVLIKIDTELYETWWNWHNPYAQKCFLNILSQEKLLFSFYIDQPQPKRIIQLPNLLKSDFKTYHDYLTKMQLWAMQDFDNARNILYKTVTSPQALWDALADPRILQKLNYRIINPATLVATPSPGASGLNPTHSSPPTIPASSQQSNLPGTKECPECKTIVRNDAKFCSKCRHNFQTLSDGGKDAFAANPPQEAVNPKPEPTPERKLGGVFVGMPGGSKETHVTLGIQESDPEILMPLVNRALHELHQANRDLPTPSGYREDPQLSVNPGKFSIFSLNLPSGDQQVVMRLARQLAEILTRLGLHVT